MKKILSVILAVLCLTSVFTVSADANVKIIVDGEELVCTVAPEIENDRTLVQLRPLLTALGASVILWDGATGTIHAQAPDGRLFSLQIGSENMFIEGKPVSLGAPAKITSDSTMVPVRALCEVFGFNVNWVSDTKTVNITK